MESGEKRQTIRPVRKNSIKPGDTLYLYTGMRTKGCRKLGQEVCTAIQTIEINNERGRFGSVVIDGQPHRIPDLDILTLASRDGFANVSDFFDFFRQQYELPFKGVLIKW